MTWLTSSVLDFADILRHVHGACVRAIMGIKEFEVGENRVDWHTDIFWSFKGHRNKNVKSKCLFSLPAYIPYVKTL